MRRSTARRTMRRATALRATRRRTALRATLRRTAFRATLRRTALRATRRRTALRATLRRTALRATLRRTALRTALLALRRRRAITSTPLRRPRPSQRSSRGDGSSLGSSRSAYRQPARGASPRSAATPWLHSTSGSAMGELRVRRSILLCTPLVHRLQAQNRFRRANECVRDTNAMRIDVHIRRTDDVTVHARTSVHPLRASRARRACARHEKHRELARIARAVSLRGSVRGPCVDTTRRRRAGSIPMEAAAP